MRNIKLTISYDGTDFWGWQTQPGYRTVQETLEHAIAETTGKRSVLRASGRTDRGTHAVGQVANFYTTCKLDCETFRKAIDFRLPEDISLPDIQDVAISFDANKDAKRKRYRYVIDDSPQGNPFMRRYACRSRFRLDVPKMLSASRPLLGRHDFHSFETGWPNRLSSIRTITHLSVNRVGDLIWIDVEADGFLYNMVRAIAGTLINVGRGFWPEEKVSEILLAEDRTVGGPTAPAHGLYLMRVTYD
ncbi:tRNA pseudouridine(38-40) synthase TruA [Tuwongella immobilis]|jgi:tRNA pseudouridine38-40 synthase|uniref:tRNA pseudouridine synthase A n=1 Tax=Tuwongella immobilis TaxID=692036 RepID=A0A6C2YMS5_9BACT|nr:tRNA pseudouridine(38-40) synthase TruA [Tuwongella immobilis]VIP02900.1 trna pseudouridine synthase a : tRNA pseudouridine synthase A OS=Singulisphaera acidiphila (strain ATCC BAA-1392 / DSM 18658 / VKM B-2454 / MOB10) GN=truA PE=3 SV=1: PseudoU_synth_1: PseudoU_synth_1 [Tuwongella immobilis]VTS02788.1 trna pseudouridine synthase a : tRNA pseudouridine synthase A OS=Singulisphaera acidiphila (strain ATCC BAA-1392 / DSM 18658 / VKM B-2454 / MOB10) GN=truA PE=3 SV=1: PseudoU_synth_1: PseudoU_sy